MGRAPSCPVCKKPVEPARRDHAPFCSARCKTVDLGKWLGGEYAVPAHPAEEEGDASPPLDDAQDRD